MTPTASPLITLHALSHGPLQQLSHTWSAGVSWVCGDEGRGKTTLLRLLAGVVQPTTGQVHTPDGGVFWVDLQTPAYDAVTVRACWDTLRLQFPKWDDALLAAFTHDLDMTQHVHKALHMLSTGSRRKVMVLAALASGATVTLLDQPFAGLDSVSIRVIKDFLREAAQHRTRAWIVADYVAPADVPLANLLDLDAA